MVIATERLTAFSPADLEPEEDPESGTEVEKDEQIEEPFDPELVRIRTRQPVIQLLAMRHQVGDLDLEPDFQRLLVWDDWRKSRFIESLLLRIPIPVFYVAADTADKWSVVDGVQRLSTIFNFMNDGFTLKGLEFLNDFHDCRFTDLPGNMQRRIRETELIVNVIEEPTPPEVMYNVFLRVNTGGIKLNSQEIRNAMIRGEARQFLKTLADSEEFKLATHYSINSRRMIDRELALRFVAFFPDKWVHYNTNSLDKYLHDAMTSINELTSEARQAITRTFKDTMRAASDIFHDQAFRKPPKLGGNRRPVNKALFEAWTVQLALCDSAQIARMIDNKDEVNRKFICLIESDRDFDDAISYSTATANRVKKRHRAIAQLIAEVVS